MEKDLEFDNIDRRILSILMEDASIPYTDIAKKVHVSSGTVHVRMKKLTDLGIVKGSQLKVDYSKLGHDITAFLGIYLERSSFYDDAVKGLEEIPEIVDVHYTTGNYSMFIKIICRDTNHLRQVLHDKIQKVAGIQRTETFISLQESFSRNINL